MIHFAFTNTARVLLNTGNALIMNDNQAINLMFHQIVQDVLTSRYPIKQSMIDSLAALQLQATFGNYNPDIQSNGWLQ